MLAPAACRSAASQGRLHAETECPLRPPFQHDRDRILHSKAFRRLKHKTQVFLAPEGDHYRTRLTHTLEVAQIARTIARCLQWNEDLTEAIALGHDLGHTPFGHAGERALNRLVPSGFHHVRQSLRVVDQLEKGGQGLNLTYEVRNGIRYHSKGRGPILEPETPLPETVEGRLVRLSDIMAYVSHDLDDAIRAGLIDSQDVPAAWRELLGERHAQRINAMVIDVVTASRQLDGRDVALSSDMATALPQLREWLFANVYHIPRVYNDFVKADHVVEALFQHYMQQPQELGPQAVQAPDEKSLAVQVADFIAGMTDRYALHLYQQLFLPQPWAI